MTPTDVTVILAQLNEVLQRLARIEERTLVLGDHEVRIRDTEQEARRAASTAAQAAVAAVEAHGAAEALALRVELLEDRGLFSVATIWKTAVVSIGAVASAAAIYSYLNVA